MLLQVLEDKCFFTKKEFYCLTEDIQVMTPFFLSSLMISMTFQALVIDYKLTYPSGTATAVLINGFHTPQGEKNAKYKLLFTIIILK
jgi:uncharacterized oligopeptide transporter (OPT) family protein